MSLKAFHIVFIVASTLLALGYAIREFDSFTEGGGLMALMVAILALVAAMGLVVYGIRFMKKLKHVRMM